MTLDPIEEWYIVLKIRISRVDEHPWETNEESYGQPKHMYAGTG